MLLSLYSLIWGGSENEASSGGNYFALFNLRRRLENERKQKQSHEAALLKEAEQLLKEAEVLKIDIKRPAFKPSPINYQAYYNEISAEIDRAFNEDKKRRLNAKIAYERQIKADIIKQNNLAIILSV